ncbi:MAG TPA: phosphoglycerate kinase [Alphaproteobacteria bacterium]|nr:phosphoglycerate kinase [Alphaproteobacteria bacterium]
MPEFTTLDRIDPRGKKVLVRVDLNVPMKDGRVTDRTRIDRAAATLRELAERGGRAIVLSHFGRPRGKDPALSLQPLIQPLSEAIGRPVRFASDCIGPEAERVVAELKDGEVALLENLRFHAGEEKNDPGFVDALARLGDLYVNDAFSAAHRAHASTEGLAHRLPTAAGRLMEEELEHLSRALDRPERPLVAIVGGAKVSTKIDLLTNLVAKVDALVIGGGMANTFLYARGFDIGDSLAERDLIQVAREVEARAAKSRCRILLPEDAVVAPELKAEVQTRTVPVAAIPRGEKILDIGPASIAAVKALLDEARSLVWNGPVGAFETPPFDAGTLAVARKAAELTAAGRLLSVAGGGDTVAALAAAGVEARFSYVSTAGGAFLEWLEGKTLPGVAALAVRKA